MKVVCDTLLDPNYVLPEKSIQVFRRFLPQLSEKLEHLQDIRNTYPEGHPFYMQTKLDGWRVMMHYQDGKFQWFSRNAVDYSGEYGASPAQGSLAPIVYEHLKREQVESCILDGEVLPYDEITGKYLKPSDILSTSKGSKFFSTFWRWLILDFLESAVLQNRPRSRLPLTLIDFSDKKRMLVISASRIIFLQHLGDKFSRSLLLSFKSIGVYHKKIRRSDKPSLFLVASIKSATSWQSAIETLKGWPVPNRIHTHELFIMWIQREKN